MEEISQEVVRSLDRLGRIIIPQSIRNKMGWGEGTKLEIFIGDYTDKNLIMRGFTPTCTLCRVQSENLQEVEKGYVCLQCAKKIQLGK